MIKKLIVGFSAWGVASSALLIGKYGSSDDLVFGNYSGYIAPSVADDLRTRYGLRVDLFDYDHLVKERFEKGVYDIAITSTSVLSELKSSKAALKLDWSKLLPKDTNGGGDSADQSKSLAEARGLFTEIVEDMSGDLLEYGIPYFIQKLGFYYRGKQIDELKKGEKVSFKKLVEVISKESRFHSENGKPKLGLIDDPRTVLSFARKVAEKGDLNPSSNEYGSSDEILKDYKKLIEAGLSKDQLGSNFLFMHSDSGPLVDALSSKTIQGAFMYNGDGLFAANGGNAELKIDADDFHYVDLSENIYFLDFLTFSSKMSPKKEAKAYAIAKELMFLKTKEKDDVFKETKEEEGARDTVVQASEEVTCKNDEEESEENESEYVETVVKNFDEVQYTPTLKLLYDNLKEYFKDEENNGCNYIKESTKHEIIKVDHPKNGKLSKEYEKQLTPQQKSDMLIAYSEFKSLL